MIRKFFLLITGGALLILSLFIGGIGLFIYSQKDNFMYKGPQIEADSQVLGEATIDLEERIDTLEKNLDESGTATLILTEFEAEEFITSFITNSNIKWLPVKADEFYLDFALNTGYFHSAGPFGLDISSQFVSEETEAGTYYPKPEKLSVGPIKLPDFISDKLDQAVYQAIEQMKTQNFGSRKLTKLRFMQDKVVVEFEKV